MRREMPKSPSLMTASLQHMKMFCVFGGPATPGDPFPSGGGKTDEQNFVASESTILSSSVEKILF